MSSLGTKTRAVARGCLINGALLSFSLLLALILAEVAIRIVAPQQLILIRPDLWQPTDTVGWVRRPNVNLTVNTGERTVHVMTDADGFRIGKKGVIQAKRRVLLLGDSFVESLQVEHEGSLAGLLETNLPALVGEPVLVRNAGINGWAPAQYLARAKQLLARETYDVIVTVIFLGNDTPPKRVDNLPPRPYAERAHFHIPAGFNKKAFVEAFLMPINDALEVRSHFYTFTKNKLRTLRMRAGLSPLYLPSGYLKKEANSPAWQIATDIATEINQLGQQQGAKMIFVLLPDKIQVNEKAFHEFMVGFGVDPATVDLEQPNRILNQKLKERGLNVIDVLPDFRQAYEKGTRLYGTVDIHMSPDGQRELARIVTPAVAEALRAQ